MNVLIRGVRFSMRIGRANSVKNALEPKADSTDTNDLFYMGDADPDRVRVSQHSTSTPAYLAGWPLFSSMIDADMPPSLRAVVDHRRGDQRVHLQPLHYGVPPRK